MVKIVETDERITLEKQLDEDICPIVMMNKFNVDPQGGVAQMIHMMFRPIL
jgi:hypothetical protein